jgi:hypothetical protein
MDLHLHFLRPERIAEGLQIPEIGRSSVRFGENDIELPQSFREFLLEAGSPKKAGS